MSHISWYKEKDMLIRILINDFVWNYFYYKFTLDDEVGY